MLNFSKANGEAVIEYGASNFMILKAGAYVRCAVTDKKIPLDELKYWNDDRQEAYIDAQASLKRWKRSTGEVYFYYGCDYLLSGLPASGECGAAP